MTMLRRAFLPSTPDLLAFEAAARHQSVSRAAEELHLTQSAVSKQVQELERWTGTALFERVRKRLSLTPAGQELLEQTVPFAQEITELTYGDLNAQERATLVALLHKMNGTNA